MQVKIEISSFEGHADLSGAELEVLTRAMGKVKLSSERYLESAYVTVEKPGKVEAKFTVVPSVTFMSEQDYDVRRKAQDLREAKLAADQQAARAERAVLILACVSEEAAVEGGAFGTMIALLQEQSFLYYGEQKTARLASIGDNVIVFELPNYSAPDDTTKGYTGTLTRDGKFSRVSRS